ncbi:MAG: hypothetical protein J1E56_07065 [Ruminococcus sp.]|nr:hypothetical protein [Ruminococcus sp.]
MKFKNVIKKLSKALSNDCDKIVKIIDEYKNNFKKPNESLKLDAFDKVISIVPLPNDPSYKFDNLNNMAGVYIFVMKNDCPIDKNFNISGKYRAKLRDKSKLVTGFEKGDILYVGKCKQLDYRMHSHMDNSETNKVGSLKLTCNERKNLIGNFIIFAFCLKQCYKEHYSVISARIEKELRDKLKPSVGQ